MKKPGTTQEINPKGVVAYYPTLDGARFPTPIAPDGFYSQKSALALAEKAVHWKPCKKVDVNLREPVKVNYPTPTPQPTPDYSCMAPTPLRAPPTRTTPQHTSEQVQNDLKYELPVVMDMSTSGGSCPILEVPLEIPDQSPIEGWDEQLQKVRLFNALALQERFYNIRERLTPVIVSPYELGEIAAEHGKGIKSNPYTKKHNPVENQQWTMGFEDWTC